jgi:predicted ATPase/DNA-binding winged helix-turn-helix (wHTH) protein
MVAFLFCVQGGKTVGAWVESACRRLSGKAGAASSSRRQRFSNAIKGRIIRPPPELLTVPLAAADEPLRFGHFELFPNERRLRVRGEPVELGARAFDLLLALAERSGRLVGKQELLDIVWPGVVVEEHNIATQVSTLRKLLGADAIATVPGRGYRLTAPPATGFAGSPAASAPAAELERARLAQSHLPRELTPLVGRADDLTTLAGLVQRSRLVTLVGAGGMGKSLLAQHLLRKSAAGFEHGACWIELASVSDAAALPVRIAEALGVRPGPGEPLQGLGAAVSSLTMLIALDNAEHLLADVAAIAAALLETAPGLRLLVTSQAPLRLAAERVYRVGPLAVPEGPLPAGLAQTFGAVALLVERARGADARFVLTDHSAPAAIELCRQLDGSPLAIELAAARAPLLGVAQLAASMNDRLQLLTRNRDAGAPARQQTLRAALEWSHALLDENERVVFRRLGVMSGSASLAFIQSVVADEQGALDAWVVLDALGTLVDRSLVCVLADNEHAPGETRYRLLESPRVLALEQLREADEEASLRQRHARALALTLDAAWDERWSGRVAAVRWASRIVLDADNARDALRWACEAGAPEVAVAIAATLYMALPKSSHVERMSLGDLCESLAEHVEAPALRLRAWQVAVRPMMHPQQQRSRDVAAAALALARELDRSTPDRWPLYQSLSLWTDAAALVPAPELDALRAAIAELGALEDPAWPSHRRVWGLQSNRMTCNIFGEPEQPARQLQVTRRWVTEVAAAGEDARVCTGALIDAELQCGNVDAAIAIGERALEQLTGARDEWSRSLVHSNLSLAYLALDDAASARPMLRALWPVALKYRLCALCSDYPVLLSAVEGRFRTAARLAGYADAAFETRGLVRHPLEVAARARSHAAARAALGDADFEHLMTEGRPLRDDQVPELAFATEDSA